MSLSLLDKVGSHSREKAVMRTKRSYLYLNRDGQVDNPLSQPGHGGIGFVFFDISKVHFLPTSYYLLHGT